MIIRLNGLRNRGPVEFTAEMKPAEYDLPLDLFQKPVAVRAVLEDSGTLINADFTVVTFSVRTCDRCAIDFDLPVKTDFKLKFISEKQQEWTSGDDTRTFHPDNPVVDVSTDIKDELLLAVPMKILCSADCRGICPGCGIDLNADTCKCADTPADSRWNKLAELKNQLES